MNDVFKCIKGSNLLTEIIGLYMVQLVQVILPIAVIPFLTRRVGPAEWGTLAYFQAYALYVATILEFGFGLSATRDLARSRDFPEVKSEILSQVDSAKILLVTAALAVTLLLYLKIEMFRSHLRHLIPAMILGLSQGTNMIWYFQGLGRLRQATTIEVIFRISATILSVILIHGPADGHLFLYFAAAGSLLATVTTSLVARRNLPPTHLSIKAGLIGIRSGFGLFLCRASISLYAVGNSFILGSLSSSTSVGYYAGAERLSKGILSITAPINQAMYAEINRLMRDDPSRAAIKAKQSLIVMGGLGLALSAFLLATAPILVDIMLGKAFAPAVSALRIMSLLPFLICIATSLGSNWMLPLHLDRPFNLIVLSAGVLNGALAFLLAPRLRDVGMAIAVTSTEGFVCIAYYLYLFFIGKDPVMAASRERCHVVKT